MNRDYILNKIKPYLNNKGMIAEEDFNKLFSRLTKTQQYGIINTLIEANIEIDYDSESVIPTNATGKATESLVNIHKIDKLTNEQLCVIYQQGNPLALEALVRNNTKLVWSRVVKHGRKYKHKLENEDLVQYGIMGLLKAADKFDLKKDAKFTTYAVIWIDQQILRSIADYGFTIRIPIHYFEQVNSIIRFLAQNPEYTKQQIIEEKGLDKDRLEEMLFTAENIMSLTSFNAFVGEDQESELGEFIVDDTNPSVEEQVEKSMLRETIDLVLNTLTTREQFIIEQRFGLKDGISKTLEQIGEEYNVTRERIRQIEAKALRKLRHSSRTKKLVDFI